MKNHSSTVKSRLALPALTLAVVLLHAWLLQVTPTALGGGQEVQQDVPLSFVTRTVVAEPSVTASAQPPVTPPPPLDESVPAPKSASPPEPPRPVAQPNRASLAPAPLMADTSAGVLPLAAADTPASEANDAVADGVVDVVTDAVSDVTADPSGSAPAPPVQAPAALAPQGEAQPTTPALPDATQPLPPGAKVPAPVRLKYAVTANKFPFSLNAELLWQHDDRTYNAQLSFSAFGQSRVQTSQGDLDLQGLAPTRFSDKYRTELAAHFNRALNKITFSANTPDALLMAGAQDRLSVLVQLATLIASDPGSYPQATTITVQTAGPREASPWLFTVQAPERLELPGGEQDTLRLVRLPRRDFDQKVELWLAPALDYLPARIRITEHNGDYIDQQWRASEPAPFIDAGDDTRTLNPEP